MPTADTQTIYVNADDKPTREGVLHFTRFSSGDRMTRSLKVLSGCWFAAGVTVFIPIAHFILVPGFLIAGPVMAYFRYRVDRANENVAVQCPVCDESVTIEMEAADRLPLYTYCPKCNNSLQVAEN